MPGAGVSKSPNLIHEPKPDIHDSSSVKWLGCFHLLPLPDTTIDQLFIVEVSNSCTVTVTLVQIRTRSLQIGIIGDISGLIQHSFSANSQRRPANIKVARRS